MVQDGPVESAQLRYRVRWKKGHLPGSRCGSRHSDREYGHPSRFVDTPTTPCSYGVLPLKDPYPGETTPFIRNVFTLETCAHIVGSQVLSFTRESEMLTEWTKFVTEVDPDVVIGYNIANFDLPYLMDRAKALKATGFPYLGRLVGELFAYNHAFLLQAH